MDKGAHFYRCDLQVHTPRDLHWSGPAAVTDDERLAYARSLVQACRDRGLQAVAITDHHCMTFLPFVRRAAREETAQDGGALRPEEQIVVFPGIELTLGVPCQALLIFDADFPDDLFALVLAALAITQKPGTESKISDVVRLDGVTTLHELKRKLDEHTYLRGRYIILPNVTDQGKHSLLRNGQAGKYADMPCVGGYSDGPFEKLSEGTKNILAGKDKAWGNKRVACIQTSDSRRSDHQMLGTPSTWIKWANPTAEGLRQACLAQESRIALASPQVPETYIASVHVSNSAFLGPVDLELNQQYSALIGGRGTGKSTVLEYIRWALCDQPPAVTDDDAPNYQARRTRLIELTLQPHGATVEVHYVLNGVLHVVRRSAADGSVQLKIGSGQLQPATEEEVRSLLPIQAYSQKQLSDVSVRVDELTRFITAPIKTDLDRLKRNADDRAGRIRETYATRQRARDLSKTLNNHVLEERSLVEQANVIRASLTGLTDADRALLARAPSFNAANNTFGAWQAGAAVLAQKAKDLRQAVQSQAVALQAAPTEPAEHADVLKASRDEFAALLQATLADLDRTIAVASTIADPSARREANPWLQWEQGHTAFQQLYADAVQRSSTHSEKLSQLSSIESRVAELAKEASHTRELLTSLAHSEEAYSTARGEWLEAQSARDELIDRECAALTARSAGLIRVTVKRHSDSSALSEGLKQAISGSRVQAAKVDALCDAITAAPNPRSLWLDVMADLEALAGYDKENAPSENRPNAPTLVSNGLTAGDIDRIAATLKPQDWLSLSLLTIDSRPVYEFRAKEGEYIPFENASAGQQATALLKTLLNQPGPPLIIDQPEEDLDNPVMIEIVEQIWRAKQLRQMIFASHNANLVVNGDAELVAWFGYRVAADQSRGTIQGEGAIDVPDTRDAIKKIMEGGEDAFRLRREKYGF
jgi:DNA repair ATPase RecN